MNKVFILLLMNAFIFHINSHSSDTIFFTTANDTVIIDIENTGSSNTDIIDGGKLYVCPDNFDYTVIYKIGAIDNGTFYSMNGGSALPTFNEYCHDYSFPSETLKFVKKRDGQTFYASINVVWINCPDNAPRPVGLDTLCANDSVIYKVNTFNNADYYTWHVLPTKGGIINNNDTTGILYPKSNYSGPLKIKVMGIIGIPDDGNEYLSKTKSVYIDGIPNADFEYTINGRQISLNNLSAKADQYLWQFNNNQTDTAKNPQFVFEKTGKHQISLSAINNCYIDTMSKQIIISPIEKNQTVPKIEIYPTIVNSRVYIDIDQQKDIDAGYIYIFDNMGREVFHQPFAQKNYFVDVSQLKHGIYILMVNYNTFTYTKKILKI
jgi:PKD repeat protein